jgi:hypothetical protein
MTYPVEQLSTTHDPLWEKINSFAHLPAGWRYGNGRAVEWRVINSAASWVQYLREAEVSPIDAAPGEDGEITVAANIGGYTEIICESNGTYTIAHEEGPGRDDVYEPELLEQAAKELVHKIWTTSVGSIARTTSRSWEGFRVAPSATFRTAFPSLTASASRGLIVPYAITHGNTISPQARFPTRPYTGNLTRQFFPVHTGWNGKRQKAVTNVT